MFGASKSFCLAAMLVHLSAGAVFLERLEENPDFPGKCFDKESGTAHAPGQSWTSTTRCLASFCGVEGDGLVLTHMTCPSAAVERPCYLEEKSGEPYPLCCPLPVCPPATNELVDNSIVDDAVQRPQEETPIVVYDDAEEVDDDSDDLFSSPFADLSQPASQLLHDEEEEQKLRGKLLWW